MSPKVVDKNQRRKEILSAATRVFVHKGYAATKVEDVAHEARVAKGTVYIYFASRQDILLAAFESFEAQMLAAVREAAESGGPSLSRLRSIIFAVLSNMEAEPELSKIVLDFWAAGVFEDGKVGIDFGRIYAEYRHLVVGLLEEAAIEGSVRLDLPGETPAVIVGTIEGILLQWIVDPEAVPLRRIAEPVLDVLLSGLATKEIR